MKKIIILFGLLLTLISCNENTTTNNVDKNEVSNNLLIEKMEHSNTGGGNGSPLEEKTGR